MLILQYLFRYRQTKLRLQAELKDHLQSKMEALDSAHSSCEYAREHSELCSREAKIVLVRAELIAGDYDCQLSGVYGDVDSQSGSDSELIPLLKQLIAMLESGGPFYLSPDLLNLINQGQGGNTQNVNNINITGAAGAGGQGQLGQGQGQPGEGSSGKGGKGQTGGVVKETLVKSGGDTTTIVGMGGDSNINGALGGKGQSSGQQTDLEKSRAMFEKQAYEAAKLENDLKKSEIDEINQTVDEYEDKKSDSTKNAESELMKRLQKAKTAAEKEKLMMDHAKDIQVGDCLVDLTLSPLQIQNH